MTKGGVYLPMPEHMILFCRSKCFVQCHQYTVGCESIREAVARYEYAEADSRRKFHRIKEEVPVSVAVVDSAFGESHEAIGATTLDMSLDGIRIQSHEELHPDLKVFFSFNDEFSVPNWKGLGEIRWTKKAVVKDMFESGVVITDNESYHAVGQHIGIPGFPHSRIG